MLACLRPQKLDRTEHLLELFVVQAFVLFDDALTLLGLLFNNLMEIFVQLIVLRDAAKQTGVLSRELEPTGRL